MTEIKNIVFTDCKKNPLTRFFCFINYLLPLRLKYANESFVALNDNIQQGLITLVKDTKSHTRFKITKLILEENSTSIANQLVNYVISRYRAMGAHAFYVVVDEKSDILLNIFKNELNFRTCGYEYLYKINSINTSCTLFLKPFKKELIKNICNFYNESINSFNRFLFSRETYQFLNKYEKFIFYNDNENKILGYFEVATRNHVDYYINFTIDFAYNIYLTDAIKFIYSKLDNMVRENEQYKINFLCLEIFNRNLKVKNPIKKIYDELEFNWENIYIKVYNFLKMIDIKR